MERRIQEISYYIASILLLVASIYNIISAHPDAMDRIDKELKEWRMTEEQRNCIEKYNIELDIQICDKSLNEVHVHDWKYQVKREWYENEDGRGKLVMKELLVCGCEAEKELPKKK